MPGRPGMPQVMEPEIHKPRLLHRFEPSGIAHTPQNGISPVEWTSLTIEELLDGEDLQAREVAPGLGAFIEARLIPKQPTPPCASVHPMQTLMQLDWYMFFSTISNDILIFGLKNMRSEEHTSELQ